jgi:hypothetical protein
LLLSSVLGLEQRKFFLKRRLIIRTGSPDLLLHLKVQHNTQNTYVGMSVSQGRGLKEDAYLLWKLLDISV